MKLSIFKDSDAELLQPDKNSEQQQGYPSALHSGLEGGGAPSYPRADDGTKRVRSLSIRLSDRDRKKLDQMSDSAGLKNSEYVRAVLFGEKTLRLRIACYISRSLTLVCRRHATSLELVAHLVSLERTVEKLFQEK